MAQERVEIIISETGSDVVVKKIATIGSQAQSSGSSVNVLKGALASLGTVETLRGLADLLDTYQTATNRLSFVSRSQEEATATMSALMDVANRSRTSFESTINTYSRVALATENMGISHQQASRLVQTLNEAITLSGATTREANSAIVQFTQGLAAGTLRGRELRSMMQELPAVADIIAAKLGVTRGALRQMGTEGKVSAELMVNAILEASNKIDAAFAKTSPRIQDQITILKNNLLQFVIELNERFQIIPRVVAVIDFLGQHMELIGRLLLVGGFVAGLEAAIAAVNALGAAILANPIGILAIVIVAAATALAVFSDRIHLSTGSLATLGDFGKAVFQELRIDAKFLADTLFKGFDGLTPLFREVFGNDFTISIKGILTIGAKVVDTLVGIFKGARNAIQAEWQNLPATIEAIFIGSLNIIIAALEKALNGYIMALNLVLEKFGKDPIALVNLGRVQATEEARKLGQDVGKAFSDGFHNEHSAQDLLSRLMISSDQIAKDRIAKQQEAERQRNAGLNQFQAPGTPDPGLKTLEQVAVDNVIRKLQDEAAALQQIGVQKRINLEYDKIEEQNRNKGVQFNDAEKQHILQQLALNDQLKIRSKLTEEITGKQQDLAEEQNQLNQIIAQGTGHLDAYVAKLRDVQAQQLLANRDMVSGFKAGFLELQNDISDFAKQSASLVKTAYGEMQNSLVEFVKTGKMNWASLTDSILSNLLKMAMNQAVIGLIGALGGSASGGLGGLFATAFGAAAGGAGGARADGGPVSPGKSYLVGERGPEIVHIGAVGGMVVPNHMLGGSPPQVNVHVVNVTDPNEIAAALNHPANQDVVVNVIRKNKGAVRAALA